MGLARETSTAGVNKTASSVYMRAAEARGLRRLKRGNDKNDKKLTTSFDNGSWSYDRKTILNNNELYKRLNRRQTTIIELSEADYFCIIHKSNTAICSEEKDGLGEVGRHVSEILLEPKIQVR